MYPCTATPLRPHKYLDWVVRPDKKYAQYYSPFRQTMKHFLTSHDKLLMNTAILQFI